MTITTGATARPRAHAGAHAGARAGTVRRRPLRLAIRRAAAGGVLVGGGLLGACGGGGGDGTGGTVAPPTKPADSFPAGAVVRLTVADPVGAALPDSALVAGEAPAVSLSARAADGSVLPLPDTLTVRWTSSAAAVLAPPAGTGTSGTLTAVGQGTAQVTASVTLRQNGAALTATASVARAVRAESLTVFTLAAPPSVRTSRTVALTIDARGRRGTALQPVGLTLASSAPAVIPAPPAPAGTPPGTPPGPVALSTTAGGTGGTATLTATALGRSAAAAITVTAPPVPIELVFEADAPAAFRAAMRAAADRWEDKLTAPLADAGVQNVAAACNTRGPAFSGRVPGVRVYVFVLPDDQLPAAAASGGACEGVVTPATPLGTVNHGARSLLQPVLGGVTVRASLAGGGTPLYLENLAAHELGHVLGIGSTWSSPARFDYSDTTDYRMNVPAVAAAFRAAGGEPQGARAFGAPVEMAPGARGHWRASVFGGEVMSAAAVSATARDAISAVTLAALQSLGYAVDLGAADPYRVPAAGSGGGAPGGPSFSRGVAGVGGACRPWIR